MAERRVAASWRGSQGKKNGRRNRKGPRRRALSRLFKLGGEAQARGLLKRMGVSRCQGAGRSRLLRPLWVCAPSPSPHSSLVPASPSCPRAVLLPGLGIGSFPAALARGAVALRDVLVSGGPGISAEAGEGEEAARETQKGQFTEKCSLSPFGDFLKLKGCKWRHPNRETPPRKPA